MCGHLFIKASFIIIKLESSESTIKGGFFVLFMALNIMIPPYTEQYGAIRDNTDLLSDLKIEATVQYVQHDSTFYKINIYMYIYVYIEKSVKSSLLSLGNEIIGECVLVYLYFYNKPGLIE